MKKALVLLPALAACQTTTAAPAGFAAANAPISEVVLAAVPADARGAEIVVRDRCDYLFRHNRTSPIVTEAMRQGGFENQPFCVG